MATYTETASTSTSTPNWIAIASNDIDSQRHHYHYHHPENFGRLTKYILDDDNNNDKILSSSSSSSFGNIVGQQEQEKIDFSKHHYHTCNDNGKILSSSNITTTTILEPLTTTTTTTTTTNIIPLNTKQQSSSSSSILLNNLYQTNIDSDNHLSSTTKSTSTSCHYSTINDNKNQYQKNFCPGDDDDPKSLSLNNPHIFNLEKNILLNNNNNTVVDIDVITAATTTTNTTTITIGNLETKTRNSCNSSTNNNNNNNESRSCTSTNSKNYFKQQHTSSSTLSNLVSHIDDDKISSGENSKINDHHTAATFVKQQQQQNQNTEIKKYSNNNNNDHQKIFATELVNHHNYDTNQLKTIKKLLKNHFDELSTSNCHLLNEKFRSKSKSKQQRKRKMTAHNNNNNNNNAGVHYNEQRQSQQQQHHHRKSSSTKSMIIIDDHNHHHIDDNDDYVRRNSRQNLHVNHRPNRRSTTTNQQFINNSSTSSNIRPNNTKLNLSKSKLSTITTTIASNENKNLTNIQSATTTTTIGPITTMNLRNRTLKIAATATATEQHPLADISTSATCPQTTLPPTISDTIIKNFNDNESTGQQQQQQRRRSNRCQNKQAAKSIIDSSSSKSSDHQQQQQSSLPASSLSSSTTTTLNSSRSIRSFFPLRTIGSVCELFRSQLDPGQFNDNNDDDDNNHQSTNRNEPDLALLSIVLGIIETSLTRGLYVDHSETTTTSINNNENSMTTTLSDSHDQQQQSPSIMTDNVNGQRQNSTTTTMNNGSYSPAEASIAPIVPIVSNIIHTPLDIPIPTVYYENVENLLKKFQQHIKESIDLDKFITDNVELINKPNNDSNSNQDSNHTTTTNRNNDLRELIKKISELIWSNLHRSHYKDRAHLQTIYSYVSENKLDCYGVAYTVLAACQILGLDDVRLVMSEDHAWVTFGQGETCEVTWHGKCGNDDRCGQSIPTTMESLNCWLYLNGNTMTCDRFQTIGTLVSAMNLSINATQDSEELAILQQHLLWILYDFGYLERYPMALGNLGDIEDVCSIHSTTARKHPLELFNEAIESARKYYNDYHVYPYTYLGGYYFRKRQFKQAFRAWADAARVVMKYNYTRDDEEIYKEFQEISNDLIPYIVKYSTSTAIAADGNDDTGNRIDSIIDDPECFVYLLQFYDGLCAWEEDSTTPVLHIGWTKPIVSTISKFPYRTRSQIIIKVDPTLNIKHQLNRQSSLIGDVDHHHYHSDDLIENSENHNINIVSGNQHLIGRERRRRRAASIGQQPATPPVMAIKQEINNNGDSNEIEMKPKSIEKMDHFSNGGDTENDDDHHNDGKIVAILVSKKFSGIKNLLTADKLNTSAIQLQLTAQSQVNIFNHGKRSSTGIGNTNRMFSTGKSSCGPFSEMDYILSSSTTTTTNYGSKSTIANSPSSTCGGGQQIRTNQSSSNININQNSNNKRLRRE